MLHHQIPFLYVFPYLFMICLCVLYYIPMYSSIILFCTTYLCNFSIIFFPCLSSLELGTNVVWFPSRTRTWTCPKTTSPTRSGSSYIKLCTIFVYYVCEWVTTLSFFNPLCYAAGIEKMPHEGNCDTEFKGDRRLISVPTFISFNKLVSKVFKKKPPSSADGRYHH